jgi:hypothetical protein
MSPTVPSISPEYKDGEEVEPAVNADVTGYIARRAGSTSIQVCGNCSKTCSNGVAGVQAAVGLEHLRGGGGMALMSYMLLGQPTAGIAGP